MDIESAGNIVKTGLRSIAASFPGFATVAQAWNEMETKWRNDRTDIFFDELTRDLQKAKDRILSIETELTPRVDIIALLERTVEKVKREASAKKIKQYSLLLANTIAGGNSINYDDGVNFIDTLDSLTDQDIEVLGFFKQRKHIRVDSFVSDGYINWTPIGQAKPAGADFSTMSRLIVSLSKLQSRGLIAESIEAGGAYGASGDPRHWYNQWKIKSFELLPFGETFIKMLE